MLTKIKRVIIILLDSVGIGELPDAFLYDDVGSDTLGNIADKIHDFKIPNLSLLGLANIKRLSNNPPVPFPEGCFGKMNEESKGKDSTTGHWEIAGLKLDKPFPTYPFGFPPEVIKQFEKKIGREVLGNKVASGTEIIAELGEEHCNTGKPIIYTSADSVFQVAAHEEVIPLNELYRICETARSMLQGEHAVGRVIARPFIGKPGSFARTPNRKDFSMKPTGETVLDLIKKSGRKVYGIGKIEDLYAGQGLTDVVHTKSNQDGIQKTIQAIKKEGDV
ncbi:MAG TPA: phosphopentomutase, partial [Firmicutes bacterium]|nr:phosphopentomutase [Bacillota bacterium]